MSALYEDHEDTNSPPHPTLIQRAKSWSDFSEFDITRTRAQKQANPQKRQRKYDIRSQLDALTLDTLKTRSGVIGNDEIACDTSTEELLQASQQEFLLYHGQLEMTERHLGTLVEDANNALGILETLCKSFRTVEEQTTSFRSQCDDLLTEQKRLEVLAEEVGTDLHYYAYLDNVSRRLNAPGAGRLVDDEAFGEVLSNLDSCIAFMEKNVCVPLHPLS